MRTPTFLLLAAAAAVSVSSCDRKDAGRDPATGSGAKVLATVNGVAITELDVEQRSRGALAGGAPGHDVPQNVVQTLVRDELVFQKAVQLGLDREPGYRAKVDELRAQLHAVERQELAALYRRYVRDRATVTDAEAREYWEQNASLIQARYHVLQILQRGKQGDIAKDLEEVRGGKAFEEVAARRFPPLPEGARAPWDLGELSWVQLPPSWRGIVDRLEPGQVSDVIQGPNERFWIVKLAAKTADRTVAFDGEKERIVEHLKERKAAELYDRMLGEMREKATIVLSK